MRRLDSLTSLRFFAAFAVLLHHLTGLEPGTWLAAFPGQVGVTFFFVLSGFVLTWTFTGDTPLRVFYRRRFARVWPLHAVTWLAVFVLFGDGIGHPWAMLAALFLVQSWVPRLDVIFGMNFPAWSLSCEVFFYLLLPFVAPVIARLDPGRLRRLAGWAFAALALPAVAVAVFPSTLGTGWLTYSLPLYRLPEFVLGVVLCAAVRRGWVPVRLPVATVLLFAPLVPVTVLRHRGVTVPDPVSDLAMLPGVLLVIGRAACDDVLGAGARWLRSRLLVRLGEWSFALYLTHALVFKLAVKYRLPHTPAMLAVLAVVMVALSGVAFTLIERPAERRLRRRRPVAMAVRSTATAT